MILEVFSDFNDSMIIVLCKKVIFFFWKSEEGLTIYLCLVKS